MERLLHHELEAGDLDHEDVVPLARDLGNERPMLPHATASRPSARRHASIIPVTVVFPFVPVTARYGAVASRAPSSISPQTGSRAPEPTPRPARPDARRADHDQGRAVQVLEVVSPVAELRPEAR